MVQVEIEYQNHIPSYLLLCSIYHVLSCLMYPVLSLGRPYGGFLCAPYHK